MAMKAVKASQRCRRNLMKVILGYTKGCREHFGLNMFAPKKFKGKMKTKRLHRIRKKVKIPKSQNEERGLGQFHTATT